MIRHHTALDYFSAEAAPAYLASGMTTKVHMAPLPARVEIQQDVHDTGTNPAHPLSAYASPLTIVFLLALSAASLLALVRQRRETAVLRRIREKYRHYVLSEAGIE